MTNEQEKGAIPFESAPQGDTYTSNYTVQTPAHLLLQMTWRPEKPPRFRGKTRRRTRADAIARKRGEYGRAHAGLLAWLDATAALWILSELAR